MSAKKSTKPAEEESEDLDKSYAAKDKRGDLMSVSWDFLSKINFKIGAFIFIIGIFVLSNTFVETILSRISGAVTDDLPTTKGTIIQMTFVVLAYLIIDMLAQHKVV